MRLFCATVSCHWKLSRLFVFPPFTSLSYSSFFHSYISFSAGHFLPSQVLPRLFAGMKDVVTLRCSQDPHVTGRQWKILSFHFHAFLLQSDSTASADPHLPCQRELICFPCIFKLIKIKSTCLTRKPVQGYVLERILMAKAGSGQVAARGRQLFFCALLLFCHFH